MIEASVQPLTSISGIPPEFLALNDDLRFIKVKSKSKIPAEEEWPGKNNYSATDPNLPSWIESGGNWGYFLKDDTNLCVLDADKPDALTDLVIYLGDTLTVKSGRAGNGYHLLFRCKNLGSKKIYLKNERNEDLGDIRPGSTEKKYQTVGPGSLHPDTGLPYIISNHSSPVEVDREELLLLIGRLYTPTSKTLVNTPSRSCQSRIKVSPGRHKQPEGGRNNYLFYHACRLRSSGCELSEIYTQVLTLNQEDCIPPLDSIELDTIVRSAAKYPAGDITRPRIPGATILRKIQYKKLIQASRRIL